MWTVEWVFELSEARYIQHGYRHDAHPFARALLPLPAPVFISKQPMRTLATRRLPAAWPASITAQATPEQPAPVQHGADGMVRQARPN